MRPTRRHSGRRAPVASLHMRMMGTIQESLKVEVSADQVGRCRQQLEILDSEGVA